MPKPARTPIEPLPRSSPILRVVENRKGITLVGPLEEAQTQIIQAKLFAPGQLLQAQGLYRTGRDKALLVL